MTSEKYNSLEAKVKDIVEAYSAEMLPQSLEYVQHYCNHAEIEMAFEIFCLKLIEQNISVSAEHKQQILELAKLLNLDQESVFDQDFWSKIQKFFQIK